ncbi:MAG: serine hydrolase [Candidatus Eremiobacteraeota bacterium]|nr:serine hydrolase [Candidatus Eremiobacteraeota bacterium]
MTQRFRSAVGSLAFCLAFAPCAAPAALDRGPLVALQAQLSLAAEHAPGRVGIAVEDLATGMESGVNASDSLPAASTIKIPVMVEVFKQMESGTIDLGTVVHLENRDRDWGWGDMADAPAGTKRTVKQLLWLMITQSDNTATNELIRLVGRTHINATMAGLGLPDTRVGDYIRSQTETIRYALRTSPHDMVRLLDAIARDRLVDEWSSNEMLSILEGQTHNGLLPVPLPKDVKIAHKTGSLHDTLNDVGIVFANHEPYVIAVMTTELPSLDSGRAFIHHVSRLTFDGINHFETWREGEGIAAFTTGAPLAATGASQLAPDLQMWDRAPAGVDGAASAPDATAPNASLPNVIPTAAPL